MHLCKFLRALHILQLSYFFADWLVSVQLEIEDRQKFLSEMEALGQGEKYRQIIATEISQVSLAQCHSST